MSKLNNLTSKMLGSKTKPLLKAKAVETKWLMFFTVSMMHRHPMESDPEYLPLLKAGEALIEYTRIMEDSGRNFDSETAVRFRGHCLSHLKYAREGGVPFTPKHHLFLHLTWRSSKHGNPKYYSTFLDESLNGKIAAICRSAHRSRLQERVFLKYAWGFSGGALSIRAIGKCKQYIA